MKKRLIDTDLYFGLFSGWVIDELENKIKFENILGFAEVSWWIFKKISLRHYILFIIN